MTASHANSHPRSGRGTFGSILVRVIVPLWIVAGASVKLYTFNPALLPEPILDLVRLSAGALGISNLNWWLGTSLRFFIGTEIAAALVMVVNPRLARFLATFILTIFIAVLIATMAKAASRDGISAIEECAFPVSVGNCDFCLFANLLRRKKRHRLLFYFLAPSCACARMRSTSYISSI